MIKMEGQNGSKTWGINTIFYQSLKAHYRGLTFAHFGGSNAKTNFKIICMEGQTHIFPFDLFFLSQFAMPGIAALTE